MRTAFLLPGGIPVYLFTLMTASGVILGLIWAVHQAEQETRQNIFFACLAGLAGAFTGGRVGYLALQWPYYREHLGEWVLPPVGGFWGPAVLAGGLIGVTVTLWVGRGRSLHLLDAVFPLVGTLEITIWLGCWVEGCAYGAMTNQWFGMLSPDEWMHLDPRVPVQLGATCAAAVVLLFYSLASWKFWREKPGLPGAVSLLLISLVHIEASFLRADPVPYWGGLRADLWGGIVCTLMTGIVLGITLLQTRAGQPGKEANRT